MSRFRPFRFFGVWQRRRRNSKSSTTHQSPDLTRLGMTSGFVFGIDQPSIHFHIEDPLAALDEFRLHSQRLPDLSRRTGGLRQVVSHPAVLDSDVHETMKSKSAAPASRRVHGKIQLRIVECMETSAHFPQGRERSGGPIRAAAAELSRDYDTEYHRSNPVPTAPG